MKPTDAALVLGATLRLTRFVVTDDLGQWMIKDPVDAQFHPRGDRPPRWPMKHHRYVSGLDCPWCCGFWAGTGVLAAYVLTGRSARARGVWRFGAGALTLNYVAAHIAIRLGDVDSD